MAVCEIMLIGMPAHQVMPPWLDIVDQTFPATIKHLSLSRFISHRSWGWKRESGQTEPVPSAK